LQHTPQHTATHCNTQSMPRHVALKSRWHSRHTLQHTITHCNTLQHTASHCITLQHTATHGPWSRPKAGAHQVISPSRVIGTFGTSPLYTYCNRGPGSCSVTPMSRAMADIKQHTSLGVTVFDPSPIWTYEYIYINIYIWIYIYEYIYMNIYIWIYIYVGTWPVNMCHAVCCMKWHCNALQRTATHCNTLQHTATHWALC